VYCAVRAEIETIGKWPRTQIIITEVPFQTVKSELVKKIAELGDEKKIEGISEVRDESNRLGIRIVIELKRDAMSNVVLNQLFVLTPLANFLWNQ
jgi:DNA gyrase subunit A